MPDSIPPISAASLPDAGRSPRPQTEDDKMMAAARAFEAQFLTEYLRHAGVASTPDAFGGGFAEESFSSLLLDEYAKKISEAGSFGLARHIYDSLKARNA